MAEIDLNRVFGRLTPLSTWTLTKSDPPHTVVSWGGPETQPTQQEIDAEWAVIEAEDVAQAAEDAAATSDYNSAVTLWPSMPTWLKTATLAEIETYVETNVTDIASAKAVITSIAKGLRLQVGHSKINYAKEE